MLRLLSVPLALCVVSSAGPGLAQNSTEDQSDKKVATQPPAKKSATAKKNSSKKKFARALSLNQRRNTLPQQWKNRHFKMTVGQDISILLPNVPPRPNQFIISREIVEHHSSLPVVPVLVRTTPANGNVVRFKAYSPGREVMAIVFVRTGGSSICVSIVY